MTSRPFDSTFDDFNLLCLQDEEYIFYDFESSILTTPSHNDGETDTAALLSGRIKLCSQSIYAVSSSTPETITRIPFEDVELIETLGKEVSCWKVDDLHTTVATGSKHNEHQSPTAATVQEEDTIQYSNAHKTIKDDINNTRNSSGQYCITIRTSKTLSIVQHQPAAPYIQRTDEQIFFLSFPDQQMHTMCMELWHIARSDKIRSSICRGETLFHLIQQHQQSAVFDERALYVTEDGIKNTSAHDSPDNDTTAHALAKNKSKNVVLVKVHGYRITPLVQLAGWIVLTGKFVYFQPFFAAKSNIKHSTLSFPLEDIVHVSQRAFQVQPIALELFFEDKHNSATNGLLNPNSPSVLLAFLSHKDKEIFHSLLQKQYNSQLSSLSQHSIDPVSLKQRTKDWRDGKISNFDYLMHINDAAGRSFNDLTQYPIFPWVLTDYTSKTLDVNDPSIYRDLSKPIAALNPARLRQGREMHAALRAAHSVDPPWMFGSHYSNPGAVVFYIVRSNPHLMLRLQNGKFDSADRLFTSVSGAWESVTRWTSDVKELIPEFYWHCERSVSDSTHSYLINWTGVDFGVTSSGQPVSDVELPPWSRNSPRLFVATMADALESPYVSAHLHQWIDLVFGHASRGKAALAADNLFNFMTYDEIAIQYLDKEKDAVIRRAYEAQMREYGRTPRQVFLKKHPRKKGLESVRRKGQKSLSIARKLCGACMCGADSDEGKEKSD